MWKIFNKLFGWQYAIVPYAFSTEVVRVQVAQTGIKYYKINGSTRILLQDAVLLTFRKEEKV
jgi:hypothetical protein